MLAWQRFVQGTGYHMLTLVLLLLWGHIPYYSRVWGLLQSLPLLLLCGVALTEAQDASAAYLVAGAVIACCVSSAVALSQAQAVVVAELAVAN